MLNPDFRDMLSAFAAANVEFLVVGAYALAGHGIPRATGDLDFWIRRTPENAQRVMDALVAFGAPVDQLEAEDLVAPDLIYQIGVQPLRIDIVTSIDGVEFEEAWPERVIAPIDGVDVPLIGLTHLIRNKEAAGRPRDLADVHELKKILRP